MSSSEEFRHESLEDRASIVRYLEAIIDGIQRGHLELDAEERSMVLEPAELIGLEVRGRRKGARAKLSIKFNWREEKTDSEPKPVDTLTIRSS